MFANQIDQPKACAVLDSKNVALHNCSTNELISYLELLTVPAFNDILISKYENAIELLISVKKVSCVYQRIKNLERLYSILEFIDGVHFEYISNSLQKFKTHDCLTIRCTLYAHNS